MKKTSLSLRTLAPSVLVILAGLIALFVGLGPKFEGGNAAMVDYAQLFASILVVVVVSFIFGIVRYSLAGGVALAAAGLHDLLLSLALSALVGIVVPQSYLMPVMVMVTAVFTFAFTLPLVRKAMALRSGESTRELSHEQAAVQAETSTRRLRVISLGLAVLLIVAAAIGGGLKLVGWLAPLVLGLLAAYWGSMNITPAVWAWAMHRRQGKKTGR